MNNEIISASILSADFAHLGKDVSDVLAAGVNHIHFDVMDHHFVPNLTFGAIICEALRKAGITAPIDAHLMVDAPEDYIDAFAKAGANLITFHPETVPDVKSAVQKIHAAGLKAALAFNPDKPVNIADEIWPLLEMILVMTVHPGRGGQKFMGECLPKISATRQLIDQKGYAIRLGVDGGIKDTNIGTVAKAGADFFIVGSGLFHAENYQQCVASFHREINRL